MRTLSILGSTGSIGTQTLEVAENNGFRIAALTAFSNIALLEKQALKFHPQMVAVMDFDAAYELEKRLAGLGIKVLAGMEGVKAAAMFKAADTIVNALVGNIGLQPTVTAIQAGKDIALANKETLVTGGEIITRMAEQSGVNIYPIDSEHSAILQCIGRDRPSVSKIYLTASGGPFRGWSREQMNTITPADALKHPNWTMGSKITIDSATMMNKGLEVIEAKWLFGLEYEQIRVLVHPQSVVHSMVEFCDGAVMAQLGEPDMRLPIAYALTCPQRVENPYPRLDFTVKNNLTFEKPDLDAFPCLRLAYEAAEIGGTMPTVMNAVNEAAVELFLQNKIGFLSISALIENAMTAYTVQSASDIADILAADKWGRDFVEERMNSWL